MNVHNIPRAAGVSYFERTAQMTPHLSCMLRCSLDKPAQPKPKTSLYQRPPSFQKGFPISAFQYGDKQPDKGLAATPSVYSNMSKSMLAEELNIGKVTGKELAPLGNRADPSDLGLLAQHSLQKRREMLEEHACGRLSGIAFGLPMSA